MCLHWRPGRVIPAVRRARAGQQRAGAVAGVLMLLAIPAVAEDAPQRDSATVGASRLQVVEGREVLMLSSGPGSPAAPAPETGTLSVRSYETASQRIHTVVFEGRTYRVSTPLDGAWSLVVFDTFRREFASLLPSIRLELGDGMDLAAVAEALDAVDVTVFESLGFAIVDLPRGLHPADAVERVENLNGRPRAAMRLRRPGIQWR